MYRSKHYDTNTKSPKVNDQIRYPNVLLVQDGHKIGVVSSEEARRLAREAGLDLVEIVSNSNPPVCRIVEYNKYKYEQAVREKELKRKQKSSQSQMKEIRLSPVIAEHDLDTKVAAAQKFLESGHRVLVLLRYKKRENAHKELGFSVINRVIAKLTEHGEPQSPPKLEGANLSCILNPKVQSNE